LSHFQHLLGLLRTEKEADLQEYLRQVRERPLGERVEQGYTWYPLNIVQTGFALGDKAFVVVERTNRVNEPHQLRSGQMVNLFTTVPHTKQPEQTGIINFIERNRMKIILHAQDLPDWIGLGQLGVDQLFDDRSYQEMERALTRVMNAKGDRVAELRDFLTGKRPAGSTAQTPAVWGLEQIAAPSLHDEGLNPSQREAVQSTARPAPERPRPW
jgi:ATP-dependent RNA/DNA helicase IGHMBP2